MGLRLSLAAVIGVIALLTASPAHAERTPLSCDGKKVTHHLKRAHKLFRSAYALERWEQGPKRSEIRAAQKHARCIGVIKTRRQLHHFRHRLKRRLHEYAKEQRFIQSIKPYAGPGGTTWPLPFAVASCESGGGGMPNYHVGFGGAFGILIPTWNESLDGDGLADISAKEHRYGGPFGSTAGGSSPRAQDVVAHDLWLRYGQQAWECQA